MEPDASFRCPVTRPDGEPCRAAKMRGGRSIQPSLRSLRLCGATTAAHLETAAKRSAMERYPRHAPSTRDPAQNARLFRISPGASAPRRVPVVAVLFARPSPSAVLNQSHLLLPTN